MKVSCTFVLVLTLLCLTACSSNRFVKLTDSQLLTNEQNVSTSNLPNWQTFNYLELRDYCNAIETNVLFNAVEAVSCTQNLLKREALSAQDRLTAIELHNKSLTFLVSAYLAEKTHGDVKDSNITFAVSGGHEGFDQVFLNDQINLLRDDLRFQETGLIGVPAVGVRNNTYTGRDIFYPQEGIFRPVTFVLSDIKQTNNRFLVEINSIDIQSSPEISLFNLNIPVKSSSAAAFLLLIEHANIDDFSWTGLINAKQAENRRGIFAIEELSQSKIPVLMTHGLNSDPLIWRNLTSAILNDACLHKHFQLWHSYYPSGPPPFYSSMRLRSKLNELLDLLGEDLRKDGVFIGHSMGGIISKTMVTDSELALWDTTFTHRPESMSTTPSDYIQSIFIFEPSFEHNTAFFLDTPHKGSDTATSVIGYIGSALVTLPDTFLDLFREFLDEVGSNYLTDKMHPFLEDYGPNSVEVLRPGHPLMDSLFTLPIKGEAFSIIGSESAIQCASEQECSGISDGVVDYTSAYLPSAQKTIIVESSHNSFRSEKAIEFIINELKNHKSLKGMCTE